MTLRLAIAWALLGFAGVTLADELPRSPAGASVVEMRSGNSGPTVLVVAGGGGGGETFGEDCAGRSFCGVAGSGSKPGGADGTVGSKGSVVGGDVCCCSC